MTGATGAGVGASTFASLLAAAVHHAHAREGIACERACGVAPAALTIVAAAASRTNVRCRLRRAQAYAVARLVVLARAAGAAAAVAAAILTSALGSADGSVLLRLAMVVAAVIAGAGVDRSRPAVVLSQGVAGTSGEQCENQGRDGRQKLIVRHDSSSPLMGFVCPMGESARVYSRGSSIVTDRLSTILAASFLCIRTTLARNAKGLEPSGK